MREQEKMHHLGEAIDNYEDECFTINTRKPLHKIHSYIGRNNGGNLKWLEKARRMLMFTLVSLAHDA